MKQTITIENVNTNEFFFTNDHCQNHGLGPEWVPCSHMNLTKQEVKDAFHLNGKEICNPDSNFQA